MKKIYIVDDDTNIVEALSIVLRSAGYEVGAQHDEQNVSENASRFGTDLIILDVMFPQDSSAGFNIARELKAHPKTQTVPILMLSAVNEKKIYPGKFSNRDRDETWMPVDDFVEKPINPSVLLEKVKKFVGEPCARNGRG